MRLTQNPYLVCPTGAPKTKYDEKLIHASEYDGNSVALTPSVCNYNYDRKFDDLLKPPDISNIDTPQRAQSKDGDTVAFIKLNSFKLGRMDCTEKEVYWKYNFDKDKLEVFYLDTDLYGSKSDPYVPIKTHKKILWSFHTETWAERAIRNRCSEKPETWAERALRNRCSEKPEP